MKVEFKKIDLTNSKEHRKGEKEKQTTNLEEMNIKLIVKC